MNGQKAKALRKLARYSVTSDRPKLPAGTSSRMVKMLEQSVNITFTGWRSMEQGTCVLPKDHPRHRYHVLKARYRMVPIAHTLKRMHNSSRLVEAIDRGIQAQAQSA